MHLGRKLRRELRKACDYNPLTCLKTFAHPSRGNRMAHTRWYEKGNPQYLVLGHENWYWHFAQGAIPSAACAELLRIPLGCGGPFAFQRAIGASPGVLDAVDDGYG